MQGLNHNPWPQVPQHGDGGGWRRLVTPLAREALAAHSCLSMPCSTGRLDQHFLPGAHQLSCQPKYLPRHMQACTLEQLKTVHECMARKLHSSGLQTNPIAHMPPNPSLPIHPAAWAPSHIHPPQPATHTVAHTHTVQPRQCKNKLSQACFDRLLGWSSFMNVLHSGSLPRWGPCSKRAAAYAAVVDNHPLPNPAQVLTPPLHLL